ncbi:hypothetical protein WG66_007667 [Moniliophthora roreri]|nr:hypothetical protein WG66_007667 [Moniliophthora roreri]
MYGTAEEIERLLSGVVHSAPLLVNPALWASSYNTRKTLYLSLPRLFGCDTPKLSHLRLHFTDIPKTYMSHNVWQ